MSTNDHSARRQDARHLALLADLSHREAVKRLADANETEPADETRRIIERFHQEARTRAAATGQSVRSAKESLLHERELLPADKDFPIVYDGDIAWSALYGVHVRCERHIENLTRALAGVVLPPLPGQPGYQMRIALTAPARGRAPGAVIATDLRRWTINPSPGQLLDTTSQWTRCLAGRPLYTEQSLPVGILATTRMLRRRRLIPARTQPPIATLRARSGRATPLYASADAVSIPATTLRQAKSIQRSRTCSTCSITSAEPFRSARDGRHYCDAHIEAAIDRVRLAELARARAVSTVWARQVRDDPESVLIALLGKRHKDLIVRIEDVHGAVLLDQRIAAADLPGDRDELSGTDASRRLPTWVSDPIVQNLLGRRRLLLVDAGADERFAKVLKAAGATLSFSRFSLMPRRGDELRYRYRIWLGELEPPHYMTRCIFGPEWVHPPFSRQLTVPAADAVIAEMRTMLSTMAATQLTEDETTQAERYLLEESKLVDSSSSGRQARALHAADLMRIFGRSNG
ncbi:hypothetical protein L3Q67_02335 [Saccharothrix sp. AJ9571]|nr:hypothetical protein L3Q67_02335 [Saccharothrix sp. AJ9571]